VEAEVEEASATVEAVEGASETEAEAEEGVIETTAAAAVTDMEEAAAEEEDTTVAGTGMAAGRSGGATGAAGTGPTSRGVVEAPVFIQL